MRKYTVNIGLADSINGGFVKSTVAIRELLDTLESMSGGITGLRFAISETEPTLVVDVVTARPVPDAYWFVLSEALHQECIAVRENDAPVDQPVGQLIGPKPWGAFDSDKFINL